MNSKRNKPSGASALGRAVLLAWALLVAGCAATPSGPVWELPRFEGNDAAAVESYYQSLSGLSVADLTRERTRLAAVAQTPDIVLRQALLLGYPRAASQDLPRALALLDDLLKANDPLAVGLRPLARLLADNYAERQRQQALLDKQGGQLKESQRKAAALQEKLDGLADIERTLPARPHAGRPARPGAQP